MNCRRPYRLMNPLTGIWPAYRNAISYRYVSPDGDQGRNNQHLGAHYVSATMLPQLGYNTHILFTATPPRCDGATTTLNSPLSTLNSSHTFSAKEKDSETGLSYFGARYYSSDMSIWLSVDPMSDKYPSLSPYVYCADNPVRLVDPNGEDWYEKEGKMYYTTQYTSEKAFKESGIEGQYRGKFFTKNGKYYSLFGQILDAKSKKGKLTQKIDEAFDRYAAYELSCRKSTGAYPEWKNSDHTNFNDIIDYENRFGTTYENIHEYDPETRDSFTYAYGSTMRFTVTGTRDKMYGRFGGFASGNSKKDFGTGMYAKSGFHIYVVNGRNKIIGITFSSQEKLEIFRNHFNKLYGL